MLVPRKRNEPYKERKEEINEGSNDFEVSLVVLLFRLDLSLKFLYLDEMGARFFRCQQKWGLGFDRSDIYLGWAKLSNNCITEDNFVQNLSVPKKIGSIG